MLFVVPVKANAENGLYDDFILSYTPVIGTDEEIRQHFLEALDIYIRSLPETTDGQSEIIYEQATSSMTRSNYYPAEKKRFVEFFLHTMG